MARLESVLPALREGKFVRSPTLNKEICLGPDRLLDRYGHEIAMNRRWLFWDDFPIVPSPVRVADYLVEFSDSTHHYWEKETHPIGQQPEGSVLLPGSERNASE